MQQDEKRILEMLKNLRIQIWNIWVRLTWPAYNGPQLTFANSIKHLCSICDSSFRLIILLVAEQIYRRHCLSVCLSVRLPKFCRACYWSSIKWYYQSCIRIFITLNHYCLKLQIVIHTIGNKQKSFVGCYCGPLNKIFKRSQSWI